MNRLRCLIFFFFYFVGGFGTFHALVNAFVHVVMYFYYGMTALGPKFQKFLWWKRYVTVLQLVSSVLTLLHSERPKLYGVLAVRSAIGLNYMHVDPAKLTV